MFIFLVFSFSAALSTAFANPVWIRPTLNEEFVRPYDSDGTYLGLRFSNELNGQYNGNPFNKDYINELNTPEENHAFWTFLRAVINLYQIMQNHQTITKSQITKDQPRDLDSIGGGNLLKRSLDPIGGGHLLKRIPVVDSLGGGNLLKRGLVVDPNRDKYWYKKSPYLDLLRDEGRVMKKKQDSTATEHPTNSEIQADDYSKYLKRTPLDPLGGGHLLK